MPDVTYHFPPRRLGLLLGGVGLLSGGALASLLAFLAFATTFTSLTALWIVLLLVCVLLLGLWGWRMASLWRARYALSDSALIIHWGIEQYEIPLDEIIRIVPGATRPSSIRRDWLWLLRNWLSNTSHDAELGTVHSFASVPPYLQLYVVSENGVFAISPANLRSFLDAFAQYRIAHPAAEPLVLPTEPELPAEPLPTAAESEKAALKLQQQAWLLFINRNPRLALFLTPPLIFTGFLFGLVAVLQTRLPSQIPLHFDQIGTPDRWGAAANLFILPVISLLTWFANGLLGLGLHTQPRYRTNAYVLWGASWFVQALLWAGAIYIARVAQP